MTLATVRDPDVVLAGLVAWLREHDAAGAPEPVLVGYERPSVGFSTETILVHLRRAEATSEVGPRDERLVLKLPPSSPGIFPTYDFTLQARVQEAVAAAGIPTPVPVRVEDDTRFLGTPFLVMPAIAGHIVGEVPLLDPWLSEARPEVNTSVHGHYLDVIADINRADWKAGRLAEVVPVRDNSAQLRYWRDYLAWYGDGAVLVPALVEALDWCETHCPESPPQASLLWGDVRLGNVIFDEQRRPVAVLDWEMATIGAAEHDLAWTLSLDAVQDELLGQRVSGFFERDAALTRFELRLGRSVHNLEWYEIFALTRSIAIMTRIAHLRERAGGRGLVPIADNPLLEILERRITSTHGGQSRAPRTGGERGH